MIICTPGGDIRDEVTWLLAFEFKDGYFQADKNLTFECALNSLKGDNRLGWHQLLTACSLKIDAVFSLNRTREPVELVITVGAREAAKMILPYGALRPCLFEISPLQAFRIDYSNGSPDDYDRIGFQGILRRPVP